LPVRSRTPSFGKVLAEGPDEHFTVDGALLEAGASQKNVGAAIPRPTVPDDPGIARSISEANSARTTHQSTTDPDARFYKNATGSEAKLGLLGHLLMENRNPRIVDALVTAAAGTTERDATLTMLAHLPDGGRITLGGDTNYDTRDVVARPEMAVTPHVTQHPETDGRGSAIDARTTRHPGYENSRRKRKPVRAGLRVDEDGRPAAHVPSPCGTAHRLGSLRSMRSTNLYTATATARSRCESWGASARDHITMQLSPSASNINRLLEVSFSGAC